MSRWAEVGGGLEGWWRLVEVRGGAGSRLRKTNHNLHGLPYSVTLPNTLGPLAPVAAGTFPGSPNNALHPK